MEDLKIILPIIRRIIPKQIAEEIVGVQPMQGDEIKHMINFRYISWIINCYGDMHHEFLRGWCWFNGNDFVPVDGPYCSIDHDCDKLRTKDSGVIEIPNPNYKEG